MNHDAIQESYKVRSKSYISELEKYPTSDLRVKLEMNLSVSNLVLENLFSFYDALFINFDEILLKLKDVGVQIETLIAENPPDSIRQKLEAIKILKRTNIQQEIDTILAPTKEIESLGHLNESLKKFLDTLVSCQKQSEKSVYDVFSFNRKSELKNGLTILFRFISNLNPFVSGADSIYQLIKSKHIKYSTTDKCLKELNEYWNNCFSLAVSTKYLEKVLTSFMSTPGAVSIDAQQCVDETYHKLTTMQKNFYEEVVEKIKEMTI